MQRWERIGTNLNVFCIWNLPLRKDVLLELLVLIRRPRFSHVLRHFGLDHGDQIGNVLDTLAAQRFAASGRLKDVKVDEPAKLVNARDRNRGEAKQVAEPQSLPAMLNEECLPGNRIAVKRNIFKPSKDTSLRVYESPKCS